MQQEPDSDDRLLQLVQQVRACRICRDNPIGRGLHHEPRPVLQVSPSARVAICGQAPGTRVHASGRPFTDASGDRLRLWLGMTSETFYDDRLVAIIPMGFCFPGLDAKGGDLPPRKECAPAWRHSIFDLLPKLRIVLLVGNYAQRWHLGDYCKGTLTETVADWEMIRSRCRDPIMYPLPHPSWRNNGWIKRHPWFERDLLPALQADLHAIGGR